MTEKDDLTYNPLDKAQTEPQFEQAKSNDFAEDPAPEQRHSHYDEKEQFLLRLDGFDGPIDLLLELSRDQKVDLTRISILDLANQYIEFVEKARELRLELAADYLVMAAWLAYLKSRLLIPEEEGGEEPSGQELAEALAFQLRRLEAMRKWAAELEGRKQLGVDFFGRGAPEGLTVVSKATHEAELYDLLQAYGQIQRRQQFSTYKVEAFDLMCIDDALERITTMLGRVPDDWMRIDVFLPPGVGGKDKIVRRSTIAATFGASLEMAKRGMIEIRQEEQYGQIYVRKPREQDKDD